jgi:hypothetical protein
MIRATNIPDYIQEFINSVKDIFYKKEYDLWYVNTMKTYILTTFSTEHDKMLVYIWVNGYPKVFIHPMKWNRKAARRVVESLTYWRQIELTKIQLSSMCSTNVYVIHLDSGLIEEYIIEPGKDYYVSSPPSNSRTYYLRVTGL